MRSATLLDTFPSFERFWQVARSLPVEAQIDLWEHDYLAPWPELLKKLKQNYRREGVDWRQIARSRIFPHLPERLPRMRRIHRELLEGLPRAWAKTRRSLGFRTPVRFVVYVGIGCGAGWATRYAGRPACLFGLENAAEGPTGRGWVGPGLVSHEVAHLAHEEWRRRRGLNGLEQGRGPYWQLYVEGFATEVERGLGDPRSFRLRTGKADWLSWCERHRSWLARRFLRDARERRSMRPFFASWYNLRGYVEAGYWLGAEVVNAWRKAASWQQIATSPEAEVRRRVRSIVQEMARLPDPRS